MRTESNQDRFVATPSTVPARDLEKQKQKQKKQVCDNDYNKDVLSWV